MSELNLTVNKTSRFFSLLAKSSLIALAGLIPVIYLPWTVEPLEINKQTILVVLSIVSVLAWIGEMLSKKELSFKTNPVYFVVLAFILTVGISAAFSFAPFLSWVGDGEQEYLSFLTFFSLGLVFLSASHLLKKGKTLRLVFSALFCGSGLVGLLAVLDQFNLLSVGTNLIGSPLALGFYLSTMAVLASAVLLIDSGKIKRYLPLGVWGYVVKFMAVVTIIAALLTDLALDSTVLWVSLLVGLVFLFSVSFVRANEFKKTNQFFLPMLLLVSSIIFIILPSFAVQRYSAEISLSQSTSYEIAKGTLVDTSWLIGSGPGTYVMDYTLHQPTSVNKTALWDQRFDRAGSYFLTQLSNLGLLGTALFIVLSFWILVLGFKTLGTRPKSNRFKITYAVMSAWLVLLVGMFVYSSNITLSFLFWFFAAIIVAEARVSWKRISFADSPRAAMLTVFIFSLSAIGLLTILFISASRYGAEIAFAKAVANDKNNGSIDYTIQKLEEATRLNKLNDLYWRNLGNALLIKTGEIIQDESTQGLEIQNYLEGSVKSAERAVLLSPNYVVNWALLGDIYREMSPLVDGSDDLSIAAYTRAAAVSPNNPKYLVMLGHAYLIKAENLNALLVSDDDAAVANAQTEIEKALSQAEITLEKALALKSDYSLAHYYLASTYERQGNVLEAITRMEELQKSYPEDVGVTFQLGLLYLKQGKSDLAKVEFEHALSIAPNYSNALWFLAAISEEEGNFDEALQLLEKVEELNPENQLVKQRLERVREGKAAAEIPEPLDESTEIIVP